MKCQQFERFATGSLCLSAYGKMTNRSYLAQLANIFHIFTSKSTLVVFFFKNKKSMHSLTQHFGSIFVCGIRRESVDTSVVLSEAHLA